MTMILRFWLDFFFKIVLQLHFWVVLLNFIAYWKFLVYNFQSVIIHWVIYLLLTDT